MHQERLLSLLDECEARLSKSRAEIDAVMDLMRQSRLLAAAQGQPDSALEAALDARSDELVERVVAALQGAAGRPAEAKPSLHALIRDRDNDSFRVGRRQLGLTEMERRVLDVLWQRMPEPVSRQGIHEHLYATRDQASEGAIDVFVSKLRQKLKLASGGEDFLQSARGKGWALRAELCALPDSEGGDQSGG